MLHRTSAIALIAVAVAVPLRAADPEPPLNITRTATPISIDGDLSDAGWKDALRFDTWYETNPGDSVEPQVKTIGWITYDDRFFYAAIESLDPNPSQIRAQLGDHDGINGNSDDFSGVIIDSRNDSKTGLEFFANAAGTQYDASQDDSSGEDSSPDFFWDSATKKTDRGWILEMRIPFSSLRYEKKDPQTWGIILYRNMPRERRYQIWTHKLPRGVNCFVCNFNKVTGFTGLPSGGHYVAAPYVTAREIGQRRGGFGTDLRNNPVGLDGGLDLKWTPNENTAIDGTINPDFSQVESDVAVISTNERFAIFFPEKRPFFLERVDLFSTPMQAVYTRTITSPRFGARGTGTFGKSNYTLLVAQDRGGGSVIIPSAFGSGFGDQEFESTVGIGRFRRDLGKNSSISFLGTTRESEGGAHNRVLGPDFTWRPNDSNTVTGQLLLSDTRTPNRPELADEWDGRKLRGHAADLWWSYSNPKLDVFVDNKDIGNDFRADNGFIPQVGYRASYGEVGYTMRPKGFFNRVRLYFFTEYDSLQDDSALDGALLYRLFSAGFGADGKFRSFSRWRYAVDAVRNGEDVFTRKRVYFQEQFAISKIIPSVSFDGWLGDEVDFGNNRLGKGANVNFNANLRPNYRLTMSVTSGVRWLRVRPEDREAQRLFTSQFERLRAQYMFNPRMFVRAIVQNERTRRNQAPVERRHGGALSSQVLFAYKLNWQSVLYLGYGDARDVAGLEGDFDLGERQVFLKLSYALQR
ncbi:MAG: DUF5916 domain-containing protein [Acidobacteriota bacterium]